MWKKNCGVEQAYKQTPLLIISSTRENVESHYDTLHALFETAASRPTM